MKKEVIFARNEMLNKPEHHSTAAVSAKVIVEEVDGRKEIWTGFSISDCSRTISLAFEINRDDFFENSLHKVNTLLEVLTEFRDGMIRGKNAFKPVAEKEMD